MECSFCGAANVNGELFCDHCGASLDLNTPIETTQAARSAPRTQAVGSKLQNGRYEIQQILGQGGMGAVLLAIDHHLADKSVIIKELISTNTTTTSLTEDVVRNFEYEAVMLAHLSHPLIPHVTDHFQENAHYFMVMDYIEGPNLEDLLHRADQLLAERVVLTYASEVLDALQYLAQQQPPIIHRDIKPANIIISSKDGRAYLVDFGIARANTPNGQTTALGTPGYSPPEQYQGRADTRSDLYALAATMHHALTLSDPRTHPQFQFPAARELNPDLSPEIEKILAGTLSVVPEQRYQSASEMKQDIDLLLQAHFEDTSFLKSQIPGPSTSPLSPVLLPQSTQASWPVPPDVPRTLVSTPTKPKKVNHLVAIIALILLIPLIFSTIWILYSHTNSRVSVTTPTAPGLPACICVTKTANGEPIGLSDGTFIFDTRGPAAELKEQTAEKLQQGDIGSAFSLFSAVHNQDSSDAEALIYKENLRLHAASAKYITIVVATTLTGTDPDAIAAGRNNLQGAYIAQREYNDSAEQHGGVNVRILIANSGSSPTNAALVADQIARLTQQDKTIVGVMGWTLSAQALAAIRSLNGIQLPMVSYAIGDNLTTISHNFFRVSGPASAQAGVGAQYAIKTLKAQRAAIFVDLSNDASRSLAEDFNTSFTNSGKSIVATEQYTIGDARTYSERLEAGLQDALQHHPDVIYFAGFPPDVSILLQDKLPANLPVLGGNALYRLSYKGIQPNDLSHLHIAAQAYPDEWEVLNLAAQKPAFFNDYQQAFGPCPRPASCYGFTRADSGTMLSYDATSVLLLASKRALEKQHPITSQEMLAELATISGPHAFQGVTGQIGFGANGDPINKAITMVCNKGGLFKLDVVIGQFLLNGPPLQSYPAKSVC